MIERTYLSESLDYVKRIQEVQERIKFEFVETLLGKITKKKKLLYTENN